MNLDEKLENWRDATETLAPCKAVLATLEAVVATPTVVAAVPAVGTAVKVLLVTAIVGFVGYASVETPIIDDLKD